MNIFNNQTTGAKGLRISATVCVILGWIVFIVNLFIGMISTEYPFLWLSITGAIFLGAMYLTAFVACAIATIAETAERYYIQNYGEDDED